MIQKIFMPKVVVQGLLMVEHSLNYRLVNLIILQGQEKIEEEYTFNQMELV